MTRKPRSGSPAWPWNTEGPSTGDVVIDMICHHHRSHNEGDDPSMTNPLMYQVIDSKRSIRRLYTEHSSGAATSASMPPKKPCATNHTQLDRVFTEVRELEKALAHPSPSVETAQPALPAVDTAITATALHRVADTAVTFPDGITPHPFPRASGSVARTPEAERAHTVSQSGFRPFASVGSTFSVVRISVVRGSPSSTLMRGPQCPEQLFVVSFRS